MNQPLRFSSAASLIVLGTMIAGCATSNVHFGSATHFGGKADVNTGLAVRALAALNSNRVSEAVDLAQRAVAKTPSDAGFRALLGNCYFADGRFQSAESAYRDALTLYPSQPHVVLKLALVEIAQGKNREAVAVLNANRDSLDASDYGLALALAGHPGQAIAVLEPVARQTNADATVRQNLALAHALVGDWIEARAIAAQDVPANQLDARMQRWMQLAKPAHSSDQVAALVGVTPAASDPGQPVQLALNKGETQEASAAPVPAARLQVALPPAAPAEATLVRAVQASPAPAPVAAVAPALPVARPTLATMASVAVAQTKAAFASALPHEQAIKPATPPVAAPRPQAHSGKSPAVVQLGAYKSPDGVLEAWNGEARKFSALKAYMPMSARFASSRGLFYRLSVRGFDNLGEAHALCNSLRRKGGNCFVRNFAGDAPVNFASR